MINVFLVVLDVIYYKNYMVINGDFGLLKNINSLIYFCIKLKIY